MDHARAQAVFDGYFAGRLDRDTTRELHAHLKECDACRSFVRLRRAGALSDRERSGRGLAPPEIQAQIARNRNLLFQILLLMVFAWFVWKMKR